MQNIRYLPLGLIAASIFAGCTTMPPENASLSEAHSAYNRARSDSQVTKLAPLELQQAGETLNKADAASTGHEGEATVNQLAYLAKQKVAIAEEIAKRKAAELEIANASAQRDRIRLEARTAEADAATNRAEMAQLSAKQQGERDQARLEAKTAEVEAARKNAAMAQEAADTHAAALKEAQANAESDQARIAEQDAQLKALQAKKTDRGMVITLGDVLFNVNKANLSAGGINNVRKLAAFLTKYPERKVMIEGHTDSTGSDSSNQVLSERRANAVKAALTDMGISSDRVAARGYGESSPVATNDTAAGRQMNRRVEIILSDDNGKIAPR